MPDEPVHAGVPPTGKPAVEPAPPAVSVAWKNALGHWLQKHIAYPDAARERSETGRVVVRLTVDRDGRVRDVTISGSSGVTDVDAAAVTMLRGAILPPFPDSMQQADTVVTVPIRYLLAP